MDLKTSRIYEILDNLNLSHQKAHRDYDNADPAKQKKFVKLLKKMPRTTAQIEIMMISISLCFFPRSILMSSMSLKCSTILFLGFSFI